MVFHALPKYENPSKQKGGHAHTRLYDEAFNLLDSAFVNQVDALKGVVYSNAFGDVLDFDASRVACLTMDDKVVSALTYRVHSHSTMGPSILVSSSLAVHRCGVHLYLLHVSSA